jgi:hypothetical protein
LGIPIAAAQTPPANDQANAVVSGAFTGAAQVSGSFLVWGPFNVFLYGPSGPNGNWNGTVQLERCFDGGVTWIVCGIGGAGLQAVWASAGTGSDISIIAGEVEKGMIYRLRCTAFVSGPINYRMSTTGQAALSLSVSTAL